MTILSHCNTVSCTYSVLQYRRIEHLNDYQPLPSTSGDRWNKNGTYRSNPASPLENEWLWELCYHLSSRRLLLSRGILHRAQENWIAEVLSRTHGVLAPNLGDTQGRLHITTLDTASCLGPDLQRDLQSQHCIPSHPGIPCYKQSHYALTCTICL